MGIVKRRKLLSFEYRSSKHYVKDKTGRKLLWWNVFVWMEQRFHISLFTKESHTIMVGILTGSKGRLFNQRIPSIMG